jgi:hypothetical protein
MFEQLTEEYFIPAKERRVYFNQRAKKTQITGTKSPPTTRRRLYLNSRNKNPNMWKRKENV